LCGVRGAVLASAVSSAVLVAACAPMPATPLRAVDDSYAVSQRYAAYRDRYPGISWPTLTFQSGQQVLFDRPYKKLGSRVLHADVFLPATGVSRQQGVLLVHGGGWRSGGKSHFYAIANLLAQRGYAVILPEYRLSPESPYPAGLVDVNDALVWAKDRALEFGFTKDRLALGGASAGGQMASLLAYSQREALFKSKATDDTSVNALIDLDGVLDFTTPLALRYENAAGSKSAAAQWLGGSAEQAPDLWRQASPVKHLGAQAPPTLVISSGNARFTAGHDEVGSALDRLGIRYRFFAFDNAPHDIWLFEPYLSRIVDMVDGFLQAEPAR
jgi:pectinesterase